MYFEIHTKIINLINNDRFDEIIKSFSFNERYNYLSFALSNEHLMDDISNALTTDERNHLFFKSFFSEKEAEQILSSSAIKFSGEDPMAYITIMSIYSLPEDKRTIYLENNIDKMELYAAITVIKSFEDAAKRDYFLLKLKSKVPDDYFAINYYFKNISDDDDIKVKIIKNNRDCLSYYSGWKLFLYIKDGKKRLETWVECYDSINNDAYFFRELIEDLDDESLLFFINKYAENEVWQKKGITYYDIISRIKSDDIKIEVLNGNMLSHLRPYDIVDIISIMQDDSKKITLINKFSYLFEHTVDNSDYSYNISKVMETINDDKLKMEMVLKFADQNDKYVYIYCMANVIATIQDDLYKKQMFEEYLDYDIETTLIRNVIYNMSDDNIIIEMINKHYEKNKEMNKPNSGIWMLILPIHDDELKLQVFMQYEQSVPDYYLTDIISSFHDDELKARLLTERIEKFRRNTNGVKMILQNMKNSSFKLIQSIKIMDLFEGFDYIDIVEDIINFNNFTDDEIIELVTSNIDLFDSNKESNVRLLAEAVSSIRNVDSRHRLFSLIEGKLEIIGAQKYFDCGFCPSIDEIGIGASKELMSYLDAISVEGLSTSDLKTLIGMQSRANFEKKRSDFPQYFLPTNLAQILSNMSKDRGYKELLLDSNFLNYYSPMISNIGNNFETKSMTNFLVTYNGKKNKSEEEFLNMLFNKLNIKKIEGLNSSEQKDRFINALYYTYISEFKNVCAENHIDINDLFSTIDTTSLAKKDEPFLKRVEIIREMFELTTKRVFEKSLTEEGRVVDGLLSQLSIYALNAEKRYGIESEKKELEEKIIGELLLTAKGRELIDRKRTETIIKGIEELKDIFENPNIKFPEKMKFIFSKLYPQYNGKMDLNILYGLMKNDPRFSEELNKEVSLEERKAIPFEAANFVIDSKVQKNKLIVMIINAINRDNILYGEDKLNPLIIQRLKVVLNNIEEMRKDTKQRIELLSFESIGSVSKNYLENLILFYSKVKESLPPKDNKGNIKPLNIDNLIDFIEKANKVNGKFSKYAIVLGELVHNTLESEYLPDNYSHYVEKTSKRIYRTIPDIRGRFNSKDRVLKFASYDMCDPEQFIAGSRIKTKPSCFRIGHPQADTMRYITSSPHGMIVAITDENGKFMGRVYGYRIGNAVHFTRIYYNMTFDFKSAIKSIGKAIIDNSSEIEYVTCIPDTCISDGYIDENLIEEFDGVNTSQEGDWLSTDHSGRKISVVASRKPIEDISKVQFNREEPREKFYKKRRKAKAIVIDKSQDIDWNEELIEVKNIIYRSEYNPEILDYLTEAKQVIYGEDWVIIEFDQKEPVCIKINYDNVDEAVINPERAEYDKMVYKEMNEALMKLKRKSNELTSEEPVLGGGQDE